MQLAFHPPHPEYNWAFDDIIVFAFSARMAGVVQFTTAFTCLSECESVKKSIRLR